jgi:hypothetical protein
MFIARFRRSHFCEQTAARNIRSLKKVSPLNTGHSMKRICVYSKTWIGAGRWNQSSEWLSILGRVLRPAHVVRNRAAIRQDQIAARIQPVVLNRAIRPLHCDPARGDVRIGAGRGYSPRVSVWMDLLWLSIFVEFPCQFWEQIHRQFRVNSVTRRIPTRGENPRMRSSRQSA